ncbi:hypothetical protein [Nitriliruptor alkaliphilus]|uniref:hypothetical protein n=1 Tax=Nitriliruptor alkaliphilus TaxID=427918 RepID=UPI0006975A3A|nr:hypothetical protein [Nitriliruptor alkaliphilus]
MLIAQADDRLRPGMPEAVWGAVSLVILVGLVVALVGLLVWAKRTTDRRRALEARIEHLEAMSHEDPST